MKICKVNVTLNRSKFTYAVFTYDNVKETKGSFMFKTDYHGKRVDKERIMLPESRHMNTIAGAEYDGLHIGCYCREDQVEAALKLCVLHIKKRYVELSDSMKDISEVLTDHDMPTKMERGTDF